MARVSVIIPIYNGEKYLDKCISSIVNQTMRDIEVIAVDDGSTDNSLKLLEELSSRYKGRIKILEKENGGPGSARNLGIESANGEFIKFVDVDDYMSLNVLERMYNVAKEYNVSLVRGSYNVRVGLFHMKDKCNWGSLKGSQLINLSDDRNYIVRETPGIGNKLISRDLIGDLRFPNHAKWEDLAIMPVILASSHKIFHMDEPVYNYRVNMNTTITDFIRKIPNILDIVSDVENVEQQMKNRGLYDEYREQINSLGIIHILFRVENAMLWLDLSHREKEIVVSSLLSVLNAKYPNWQEDKLMLEYPTKSFLFNASIKFIDCFINDDYINVDRETAEKNLAKVLK